MSDIQPVTPVAQPLTPVLDRALVMLRKAIIAEALQEGGPSLLTTAEMHLDVRDDPLLKRVLEVKGGKMAFVLHMVPVVEDDPAVAERMKALREAAGVVAPPPVGSVG